MPAPFSASSTLPIAALLASDASRAVLASLATPASICARSGAHRDGGLAGDGDRRREIVWRQRGRGQQRGGENGERAKAAGFHRSHFSGTIDVDHELVLRRLQGIGEVLLDEGVLGFQLLVVEVIGDRLIGVVHVVVGAAMDEFQRLALGRFADAHVLGQVLRVLLDRDLGQEGEAGVVGRGVDDHRIAGVA